MAPQLYLHRSRFYAVEPPRLGAPLFIFASGLGLTFIFGTLVTAGVTGRWPEWSAGLTALPALDHPWVRGVLLAVGAINGFLSILIASAFGLKSWNILSHRLGWHPIMESEGPCRLVQDAPDLWGLQMELDSGFDPGVPWPLTPDRKAATTCHIFFRLDEAAAGAVSHLFSPGETLQVRWLDLPIASGGPTLLEICAAAREMPVLAHREPRRQSAAA